MPPTVPPTLSLVSGLYYCISTRTTGLDGGGGSVSGVIGKQVTALLALLLTVLGRRCRPVSLLPASLLPVCHATYPYQLHRYFETAS